MIVMWQGVVGVLDELGLFTEALGLSGLWRVVRREFDPEATQLGTVKPTGHPSGARWSRHARPRPLESII